MPQFHFTRGRKRRPIVTLVDPDTLTVIFCGTVREHMRFNMKNPSTKKYNIYIDYGDDNIGVFLNK